jgi:nitrite reductase (NO-forming)
LIAGENEVQVAPDNGLTPGGRWYKAMTWNGTIPGPVISVDQGDCLRIIVENHGAAIHTLDFHAGNGPSNAIGCGDKDDNSGVILPGETVKCTLKADIPGAFMYHCAGDKIFGIWEHIANGMYGGIVVHPQVETKAKEFYMVFGEIYPNQSDIPHTASFDLTRLKANNPEYILTNGMAFKYTTKIGTAPPFVLNPAGQFFNVKPGELTRWYIVNAGPNDDVAFHFISAMISVHDGTQGTNRLGTQLTNDETWNIPAGSASVVESTFPENGTYVGVDHSMKDVVKGGAFIVVAKDTSTTMDHPKGTWVPPSHSTHVTDDRP